MKKVLAVVAVWVLLVANILPENGFALDRTWSGAGVDEKWTTPGNWDVAPDTGDSLIFTTSITLNDNDYDFLTTQFNGISFIDTPGDLASFVLNGNAINLGGNIVNDSTSLQTINLNNIVLQDNIIINANNANIAVLSPIDNNTKLITVTGANNTELNGVISGTGGLTKTGAGTLTISGTTNEYSGATNINVGEVAINSAGALGNSTAINLAGGTLVSLGGTYSLGSNR